MDFMKAPLDLNKWGNKKINLNLPPSPHHGRNVNKTEGKRHGDGRRWQAQNILSGSDHQSVQFCQRHLPVLH